MNSDHGYQDFSDDEEGCAGSSFVLLFGIYKHQAVGDVAKNRKGRETLRYYLSWGDLREDAANAIRSVLRDYALHKAVHKAASVHE